MKALQKFLHITLIAVLLMGATGFRVATVRCAGGKDKVTVGFTADLTCCCGKKKSKTPKKACHEVTCLMARAEVLQTSQRSVTQQQAEDTAAPATYAAFTQTIRPVLLQRVPLVVLPPPLSGRDMRILHQTFLI